MNAQESKKIALPSRRCNQKEAQKKQKRQSKLLSAAGFYLLFYLTGNSFLETLVQPNKFDKLFYSLLAVVFINPQSSEPMKRVVGKRDQAAVADGVSLEISLIVRLAADGYCYNSLFNCADSYNGINGINKISARPKFAARTRLQSWFRRQDLDRKTPEVWKISY